MILFAVVVVGTQTLVTPTAVYGVSVTASAWGSAGPVWGYALVWALLSYRITLVAYRMLARRVST